MTMIFSSPCNNNLLRKPKAPKAKSQQKLKKNTSKSNKTTIVLSVSAMSLQWHHGEQPGSWGEQKFSSWPGFIHGADEADVAITSLG